VTQDLTKRGLDAGKLIREIARVVGGGGGGRPTLAQAGGKDAAKLDEALAGVEKLVSEALR
jgi:alanyl-tRNA synthetase